MEQFKFQLDKSSKKNICPSCDKRTFVYFLDTDSGEYLPANYGRCDREQSCGYYNAPKKQNKAFLTNFYSYSIVSDKAIKITDLKGNKFVIPKSQIFELNNTFCYLSEWYLKQNSGLNYNNFDFKLINDSDDTIYQNIKKVAEIEDKCANTIDFDVLEYYYYEESVKDNLTDYLLNNFDVKKTLKALSDYYITGSNLIWNNSTVFWQIDDENKIRTGKIILYDKSNGKRNKNTKANWVHAYFKKEELINEYNLKQCLFGLHLINKDTEKTIAIVEGEKTALIMSILIPDFIWLATGGSGMFKQDMLEPLKNRNIVAFPDKGVTSWLKVAEELNQKGFKIIVNDVLADEEVSDGSDIADYYINSMYKKAI